MHLVVLLTCQENSVDLYKKILELDTVYEGEGQQPGGFQTSDPKEAIREIVRRMFPGVTAQIPISENLQLNHYYTRSKNEFLAKIKKGHILNERSVRYSEKLPKMLSKIDSDVVEDLCAIDFLNRLGI